MSGLLTCTMDPLPDANKPEPVSAPEPSQAKHVRSFWRRQWAFLRRRWWNVDHLTIPQRISSFLRGVILIAVAAFGMLVVVHNTLNLNPSGMDAVAKLIA